MFLTGKMNLVRLWFTILFYAVFGQVSSIGAAEQSESILQLDPRGHMALIGDLIVSPNGWDLISGSDDKTVRVWDTKSKREVRKLRVNRNWCGVFCVNCR